MISELCRCGCFYGLSTVPSIAPALTVQSQVLVFLGVFGELVQPMKTMTCRFVSPHGA